ncbi:unnamed protein product [Allacma fusca]|uniref:Uncharacterized protein n=1 Tax=Allacma fusca TaxID=39272 RepID=A0A8J2JGX5_9HEXA|nr:unnamed protein product [Allacma fusca]
METQFEEHKEAISNALGKLSIINEGSWVQLRIWGEWYLQWNWKFTANHFFNVNNSTVPAVIGTILTYFIFMLQLGMSEITAKSRK